MLKIINPATEETLRELPEDDAASISRKHQAARRAQPAWAALPLSRRLDAIRGVRERVVAETESLARVLTSEVGKPISQSRNELKGLLGRLDFFIENSPRALGEETVFRDPAAKLEERIAHEPLGVIANISAWNYPYFVGSNVFVPALIAGNAVLYKPSEFATLTGLEIARLLHASGVPADVFAPIIGGGQVGAELLKQRPLNGAYFTGSYATGQKVAEAAARQLMRVQLELGGKDPSYVREDADLKVAAESLADGAFYNTGQSCCSVERIYVHARVYDAFVEAFVQTVRGFAVGDPREDGCYIGPVTRQSQLAYLEHQVKDAQTKGARLLIGGKRIARKGYYFEPTVFADVNHTMELMREESFGPLIGIQKVSGDEEALQLMNDTEYGLTAGVYTRDAERARELLGKANAGSAYWNCCDRVSPRLPWSGRGHSGVGSTLSIYGIQAFAQPKAWHLRG